MHPKRARDSGDKFSNMAGHMGCKFSSGKRPKLHERLDKLNLTPTTIEELKQYLAAKELWTEREEIHQEEMDKEGDYGDITGNVETHHESDSADEAETDFEDDWEDLNTTVDGVEEHVEKRNGRGPTRMESLWKEHDPENKINLKFNRYGQPCGLKTCKLTNFIGSLVKGKVVSLAAPNWSKADKSEKEKLWLTIKRFFNIDESFKRWVLRSASKKWKDFKVVLKRTYFNPNFSQGRNIRNGCAKRIPDPQWAWLVKHWKSEKAQAKSEKNKAIRALQLNGTHTTGSRSFAVTLEQMEMKEGREIGRGELYVVTHTKKNGEPVDQYSGDNIKEIRRQFEANPSLVEEGTHDGDVYSVIFPPKRNGRWRGLGLLAGGSTSEHVAELKAELQEAKSENKKLWGVVETLTKNQSILQQQHNELKDMWLASLGHRSEEQPKEPFEDTVGMEHDEDATPLPSRNMKQSQEQTKAVTKETIASHQTSKEINTYQQMEKTSSLSLQPKAKATSVMDQHHHKRPRKFQTPLQKDGSESTLNCGREVALITPRSKRVVALATIQASDGNSKATDGQPLVDFIEVLINTVFSDTTPLPLAHGKISKLRSACGRCIPWPRHDVTPLDGSTVENNSKVASAASSIASIKRASLAQKNSTSVDDAKNQGVLDSKKKKRASNATKQNSTQETRKVAKPMTAPSPHLQKPTATLYT